MLTAGLAIRSQVGRRARIVSLHEPTREEKVQYLLDRQEIADVIARHARGHDRHDGGLDEHGTTINAGPAYAAWA